MGQQHEQDGTGRLAHQTKLDNALAVIAVGAFTRGQDQKKQRQELGQAHHAQIKAGLLDRQGLAGQGIDLPAKGRGLGGNGGE